MVGHRHWEEAGILEALLRFRNLCTYRKQSVCWEENSSHAHMNHVFQINIESINKIKLYSKAVTEFTGIFVIIFFFLSDTLSFFIFWW